MAGWNHSLQMFRHIQGRGSLQQPAFSTAEKKRMMEATAARQKD